MVDSTASILPLSGKPFPDTDFEAALSAVSLQGCQEIRDRCLELVKISQEESNESGRMLYRSLLILCSFWPNYHNTTEPYVPEFRDGTQRSYVPGDLTSDDLIVVELFFSRTTCPALKARLGDVLWIRKRNHKVAAETVDAYVASAELLLVPSGWHQGKNSLARALQIGGQLGRQQPSWAKAKSALLKALENPLSNVAPFYSQHLLSIALDFDIEEAALLSVKASEQAARAKTEGDPHRQRLYLLQEAAFLHELKKLDDEGQIRLRAAECYVDEAETCLTRKVPSYMAASAVLAQGIEALRRAKASPERIAELRKLLSKYQKEQLKEFQPLSFEVDLTETAHKAMDFVASDHFHTALERLALGFDTIDISKLREETIKLAEDNPLTFLAPARIVDHEGRTQTRTGSIFQMSGEGQEKEVESRMFRTATMTKWPFRSDGYIRPARFKIWTDHHPAQNDLNDIVLDNPFIPPGHEGIFRRGLYYGLAGDMPFAVHLLVPQIENSIRYVLDGHGVDTSNLQSDLTQPVKLLGTLLAMPEARTVFGDSLCFELRGLLVEKMGYAFRNDLAHGFLTEKDCYGTAAINCWWIVLRLCLLPLKSIADSSS